MSQLGCVPAVWYGPNDCGVPPAVGMDSNSASCVDPELCRSVAPWDEDVGDVLDAAAFSRARCVAPTLWPLAALSLCRKMVPRAGDCGNSTSKPASGDDGCGETTLKALAAVASNWRRPDLVQVVEGQDQVKVGFVGQW